MGPEIILICPLRLLRKSSVLKHKTDVLVQYVELITYELLRITSIFSGATYEIFLIAITL
jgi:hypothetical protein